MDFKESAEMYIDTKNNAVTPTYFSKDGKVFTDQEGNIRIKISNTPRVVDETIGFSHEAVIEEVEFLPASIEGVDKALDYKEAIEEAFYANGIIGIDTESSSISSYSRDYMPLSVSLKNKGGNVLATVNISEKEVEIKSAKWDAQTLIDVARDVCGKLKLPVKVNGALMFAVN